MGANSETKFLFRIWTNDEIHAWVVVIGDDAELCKPL